MNQRIAALRAAEYWDISMLDRYVGNAWIAIVYTAAINPHAPTILSRIRRTRLPHDWKLVKPLLEAAQRHGKVALQRTTTRAGQPTIKSYYFPAIVERIAELRTLPYPPTRTPAEIDWRLAQDAAAVVQRREARKQATRERHLAAEEHVIWWETTMARIKGNHANQLWQLIEKCQKERTAQTKHQYDNFDEHMRAVEQLKTTTATQIWALVEQQNEEFGEWYEKNPPPAIPQTMDYYGRMREAGLG